MSIGQTLGHSFSALFSLQVLFVILVYAAVYTALMVGGGMVLRQVGFIGSWVGVFAGSLAQVCLFPVVLAALAAYALGFPEQGLQFGYAFDSFGSLALSGLLGWLFALGVSFVPIVGGLVSSSQTVSNVVAAIPPVIVVFASHASVGDVLGGSLSLLLQDWWFILILIVLTKVLEIGAVVLGGLLLSQSKTAVAEESQGPTMLGIIIAAVIPFFPAMVLINRVAGYLAAAHR